MTCLRIANPWIRVREKLKWLILTLITPDSLPNDFRYLNIAARDDYQVGADVYAIGHPLGYSWTFTQGIISGVRAIRTDSENYTAIQTQTPINPGNSGGPLLNSNVEVVGINTWVRDISTVEKQTIGGADVELARPAQGLNFAVSATDIRQFLADVKTGRLSNLPLREPTSSAGCPSRPVFNGRNKADDANLQAYSLRCDGHVDAWQIAPDDISKPVEFHFDPERMGLSSIVVLSTPQRDKWSLSYWDFYRDQTFAVLGRHPDGKIVPTTFEFTRS
jgi:hypothetical protein